MLRTQITIDETIDFLNELIALDSIAVQSLARKAVKCNDSLAEHPTIQVATHEGAYYLGLLGVLNGMFGVDDDGWGSIVFVYEEGHLVKADRAEKYREGRASVGAGEKP